MLWNTPERRSVRVEAEVKEREGSVEEGKGKEKEEPPPWGRRGEIERRPVFCYHAV